jgi:hypothetical protein
VKASKSSRLARDTKRDCPGCERLGSIAVRMCPRGPRHSQYLMYESGICQRKSEKRVSVPVMCSHRGTAHDHVSPLTFYGESVYLQTRLTTVPVLDSLFVDGCTVIKYLLDVLLLTLSLLLGSCVYLILHSVIFALGLFYFSSSTFVASEKCFAGFSWIGLFFWLHYLIIYVLLCYLSLYGSRSC